MSMEHARISNPKEVPIETGNVNLTLSAGQFASRDRTAIQSRARKGIVKALRIVLVALFGAGSLLGHLQARQPASEHTVVVYWKPGRYAAWPANHGIWPWGNEILVGFESGYFKRRGPDAHPISHDRPAEDLLARSLDGVA